MIARAYSNDNRYRQSQHISTRVSQQVHSQTHAHMHVPACAHSVQTQVCRGIELHHLHANGDNGPRTVPCVPWRVHACTHILVRSNVGWMCTLHAYACSIELGARVRTRDERMAIRICMKSTHVCRARERSICILIVLRGHI